mmetsp:Transcript_32456/g.91975  ORF Transcript_32456/g.91975 Transcript_32456/m.91975 type:complete len:104 (-) Transcript_32456:621-932(-)
MLFSSRRTRFSFIAHELMPMYANSPPVRTNTPTPMPRTHGTCFDHIQAIVPAVMPCMKRYVSILTGPSNTDIKKQVDSTVLHAVAGPHRIAAITDGSGSAYPM